MTRLVTAVTALLVATTWGCSSSSVPSGAGANAPTRLAKLMDTILGQDAHVFLFVAQITPTTIDAENTLVQTYNDAIPALVEARADAGKHIALVDLYTPIESTPNYKTVLLRGTSDSLHPADKGYKLMGDVWYGAVKSVLP